jgi:hypothetical protein
VSRWRRKTDGGDFLFTPSILTDIASGWTAGQECNALRNQILVISYWTKWRDLPFAMLGVDSV